MADDATDLGSNGFGLMFYNARWYDPALSRFAQADSIVPAGVQGLDRYAYVNNSPLMYTDPTGHICNSDYFVNGRCLNETEYLEYTLEEKYSINIIGNWDLKKLNNLEKALTYASNAVGGADVLTRYFQDRNGVKKFTFLLTSDANRQNLCGLGNTSPSACQPKGMIVLSERHFDGSFTGAVEPPTAWNITAHMKTLKTLLHEIGHVIIKANPEFRDNYIDNPNINDIYFDKRGNSPSESLANAFAIYAIGYGTGNQFPNDPQYILQMDYVSTTYYPGPWDNVR